MRYEHGGLSMVLHCLEWYKLALRTRLPTPAVRYVVGLRNNNASNDGAVGVCEL